MRNKEEHISRQNLNPKKRVSWVESIKDNEGKTLRVKKKPKITSEDKEFIQASNILKNYLINKFKNGEYEEVKQRWANYLAKHPKIIELRELYGENSIKVINEGKRIIGKLACVDSCSVLRWVAINCDIEAFKLITEMSAMKYLQRMVRYDDYMAFELFVDRAFIDEYKGIYESSKYIEGFMLFMKIDNDIPHAFRNCYNVTKNIKADFDKALQELGLEHMLIDNKGNNLPNSTSAFTQRIFSTAAEATKITR